MQTAREIENVVFGIIGTLALRLHCHTIATETLVNIAKSMTHNVAILSQPLANTTVSAMEQEHATYHTAHLAAVPYKVIVLVTNMIANQHANNKSRALAHLTITALNLERAI